MGDVMKMNLSVLGQDLACESGSMSQIITKDIDAAWRMCMPQCSAGAWALVGKEIDFPWAVSVKSLMSQYAVLRSVSKKVIKQRREYLCRHFMLNPDSKVNTLSEHQCWVLSLLLALMVQPQLIVLCQSSHVAQQDCRKIGRFVSQIFPASMCWLMIGPEKDWLVDVPCKQVLHFRAELCC